MDVSVKNPKDWKFGDILVYGGEGRAPDEDMKCMFVADHAGQTGFASLNLYSDNEFIKARSHKYWTLFSRVER